MNIRKIIENITKPGIIFVPTYVDHHELPDINFNGLFYINNNIFIPKKVVTIHLSYLLNQWVRDLNTDFTLGCC